MKFKKIFYLVPTILGIVTISTILSSCSTIGNSNQQSTSPNLPELPGLDNENTGNKPNHPTDKPPIDNNDSNNPTEKPPINGDLDTKPEETPPSTISRPKPVFVKKEYIYNDTIVIYEPSGEGLYFHLITNVDVHGFVTKAFGIINKLSGDEFKNEFSNMTDNNLNTPVGDYGIINEIFELKLNEINDYINDPGSFIDRFELFSSYKGNKPYFTKYNTPIKYVGKW